MFRDAGLAVVLSSDAPVTAPDVPMACWSAETRLTSSGHVLGAGARVTRRQAFEGYTTGGALALRRTDVGAIGPGMLADFAILDDDPLAVATDRLPDVAVGPGWPAGGHGHPTGPGLAEAKTADGHGHPTGPGLAEAKTADGHDHPTGPGLAEAKTADGHGRPGLAEAKTADGYGHADGRAWPCDGTLTC